MRIDEIRRLIKLVEESQINELEVRRLWTRVRILKRSGNNGPEPSGSTFVLPHAQVAPQVAPVAPTSAPKATEASSSPAPAAAGTEGEEAGLVAIRSPMVGTFYRAPSPQSPPYVEANQHIAVGQVVCIVEAMKLMNEIESEVAGAIVRVSVENGSPVEFNQPLFFVRPD